MEEENGGRGGGDGKSPNMFFWGGLCHVAGKCVCLFREKQRLFAWTWVFKLAIFVHSLEGHTKARLSLNPPSQMRQKRERGEGNKQPHSFLPHNIIRGKNMKRRNALFLREMRWIPPLSIPAPTKPIGRSQEFSLSLSFSANGTDTLLMGACPFFLGGEGAGGGLWNWLPPLRHAPQKILEEELTFLLEQKRNSGAKDLLWQFPCGLTQKRLSGAVD